jgi:EF hand
MKRHILTLTTCAFILTCGAAGSSAEESTGDRSHEGYGMMGHGGMMGCGTMRPGGMMGGGGMIGHGAAMRIIFALMDSDGDGTVSLQEFQAAHEKIFKAMDTDKDGTLTIEEIQTFMRGPGKSAPKEHEHERE